ncbi:STAS domain-containing protein [Deltaproteobacteria bacterium TL4]
MALQHRIEKNACIIKLGESLAGEAAEELMAYFRKIEPQWKWQRLVLNLERTSTLDAQGLGKIILFCERGEKLGYKVALCCCPKDMVQTLMLCRLEKRLQFYETEESALENIP